MCDYLYYIYLALSRHIFRRAFWYILHVALQTWPSIHPVVVHPRKGTRLRTRNSVLFFTAIANLGHYYGRQLDTGSGQRKKGILKLLGHRLGWRDQQPQPFSHIQTPSSGSIQIQNDGLCVLRSWNSTPLGVKATDNTSITEFIPRRRKTLHMGSSTSPPQEVALAYEDATNTHPVNRFPPCNSTSRALLPSLLSNPRSWQHDHSTLLSRRNILRTRLLSSTTTLTPQLHISHPVPAPKQSKPHVHCETCNGQLKRHERRADERCCCVITAWAFIIFVCGVISYSALQLTALGSEARG